MELFKLKTNIHSFDSFREFAEEFNISSEDVVLTNRFLYEPFMKELNLDANFIMQEDFGQGEPSDEMMNAILKEAKKREFNRIIAVGGGTVLDIAKLLVLKDLDNVVDAFEKKIDLIKDKDLIAIPTTCGTGSEVTNISIAELKSKGTKMGLAVEQLFPDDAILIPEFLKGLPYKFYVYSSIDALIHAIESYVSPKSNPYSKLYSKKAIETIFDVYLNIIEKGEDYRFERLEDILIASNYAGIAFGNTGVGAVHALSYPLGGKYHVPHGEANYQFFTEVFKEYNRKNPNGSIKEINELLSNILNVDEEKVYDRVEEVLGKLLSKNELRTYGMAEEEIELFTDSVLESQQRLLANNYVELSREEIKGIYGRLY
ncbi:4-hydroxybutyrate dehydrogenase [Dethiothermospora halolimnae]|uniref:4-hydroxybutyrate dehydrogenase n=1 Tax=Dethiothermospora halolimnae TaxID=3114390 RepID=UPI003CCBFD65